LVAHNEHRLLSKAIEDQSLKALMERGITPDWFTQDDAQRMARFVFDWNAKYGQPPSPQAVKSNAPQFRLVQVDDPIESMCDQMVTYRRRGLTMQAAADIVDLIEHSDHESAVDVMRKSLADLDRSSGVVTSDMELTKDAPQRFSWYEQIKNRPGGLLGLPTGFPTIDKATAGVQPGQLITLIASAKVGKSVVSLQVASNIHSHPSAPSVMFQSFEMSNSEQQTRHDAMRAHISHNNLRRGTLSDTEELAYRKMLDQMGQMPNPMTLTDSTSGTTVSMLAAKIDDLGRPDFIVIDGVYLMIDEISGEQNTPLAITNITRSLKRLAQNIERPVFITTQALQWKMKKTRLNSQSAGYSSSFVQDSDVVLGLERVDDEIDDVRILRVIMSRNCGPVEAYLRWDFEHGRFEEEGEL
jgi:replicative DNA helicase